MTNITDNFFYPYAITDNFIGDLGSSASSTSQECPAKNLSLSGQGFLPHQKQAAENNTRQRTLPCHGQLASDIEEL
jgi:hypothetical protein